MARAGQIQAAMVREREREKEERETKRGPRERDRDRDGEIQSETDEIGKQDTERLRLCLLGS
jgi:hypothetical protein